MAELKTKPNDPYISCLDFRITTPPWQTRKVFRWKILFVCGKK